MILVCGGLADGVTELVCARLDACGYPYRLLDLGVYPAGFEVTWHWGGGAWPEGRLAGPGWTIELEDLTGVYVRFLGPEGRVPPAGVPEDTAPALYAEYDAGLVALLEDLPCAVVNRLAGGMSNHSKPYQALLVRQCGLRTPATLVTNDPAAVRRFAGECGGDVVFKSLSGVRSIVRRLGDAELARLPLLRHGPAQFQQYIPGEDVRVHAVGDELFATAVRSEAVDYRYARREGADVEMAAVTLPPAVADACRRLARSSGLLFAGIDLKRTPESDYYCFEVNPCPGFLYYERHTGQPISAALADLLRRGASDDTATVATAPLHPVTRTDDERPSERAVRCPGEPPRGQALA
jgi:glutathione synthase/RimK-type ligase-like ATP-grasp enzyme